MSTNVITLMDGTLLDIMSPELAPISIQHIAHAASHLCRYGGQSPHFYSVAEHCCLMVELVLANPSEAKYAKEVLLHDADECFGCVDLPRPVKQHCPQYQNIQQKIADVVAATFQLDVSDEALRVVKYYDDLLMHAERYTFWGYETDEYPEQLYKNIDIECLTAEAARYAFLDLARHLNLG